VKAKKTSFIKKLFLAIIFLIIAFFILSLIIPPPSTPKIDSTISTARDISGQWAGIVSFTERVPQCSYSGNFRLNLQQNGNNAQGGFDVTVNEVKSGTGCLRVGTNLGFLVGGTVSSSAINLKIANTDNLDGSFTTDQMTLRWGQCQDCSSGPALRFTGPMFLTRV